MRIGTIARKQNFSIRHYVQKRTWGYIKKRTARDPNEFVFDGDICKIKLYNCKCEEIAEAIIYAEDYEKCAGRKWHLDNSGYVSNLTIYQGVRVHTTLHHTIFGMKTRLDHKDGNKLNNRGNNLRNCTHAENKRNGKIPKNNISGFKGVFWHRRDKKWVARIGYNKKRIALGYFTDKVQAAIAYNKAAVKYHKEFARLNIL